MAFRPREFVRPRGVRRWLAAGAGSCVLVAGAAGTAGATPDPDHPNHGKSVPVANGAVGAGNPVHAHGNGNGNGHGQGNGNGHKSVVSGQSNGNGKSNGNGHGVNGSVSPPHANAPSLPAPPPADPGVAAIPQPPAPPPAPAPEPAPVPPPAPASAPIPTLTPVTAPAVAPVAAAVLVEPLPAAPETASPQPERVPEPPDLRELLPPPLRGGATSPVAEAARSFTTLLLVGALVGAFLTSQGRLTRRDPKLVEAPVHREEREFR